MLPQSQKLIEVEGLVDLCEDGEHDEVELELAVQMGRHEVVLGLNIGDELPQLVVEDVEVVDLAQEHVEDGLRVVLLGQESSCSLAVDVFDYSVARVLVALEPEVLGEVFNALSVVNGHQLRQENVLIKLFLLQGLPQPNRCFFVLTRLKGQQLWQNLQNIQYLQLALIDQTRQYLLVLQLADEPEVLEHGLEFEQNGRSGPTDVFINQCGNGWHDG